jgi:hypothetical protein
MFEQAAIAIQDEQRYAALGALLDTAFSPVEVEAFLRRVRRAGLRIRDFETITGRGLLGQDAGELYRKLPVSDQAQTRERYLGLVEVVAPELRERYAKVYAAW